MERGRNNRETLAQFSERALRATVDGTLIPPTVYIPVNLRKKAHRVADDGRITLNPKSRAEIEAEIAKADPTGLLIAIMQGQPIPSFVVHKDNKGGIEVNLELQTPDLQTRAFVAAELAKIAKRVPRLDAEDARYSAMIEGAANGL